MENDFIHWDDSDIDLDDLLGSCTEYEDERCGDNVEWSEDSAFEHDDVGHNDLAKDMENVGIEEKGKLPRSTDYKYLCPVCGNKYVTIQGFRGHTIKKHQRSDLKAHEHKVSRPETSKVSKASHAVPPPRHIMFSSFEDFQEMLVAAVPVTLKEMSSAKPLSSTRKSINDLCLHVCETEPILTELVEIIGKPIFKVFECFGKGTSLSADRENMWQSFHQLRLDGAFVSEIVTLLQSSSQSSVCNLFIQSFLQNLIPSIIQLFNQKMDKLTESTEKVVSENDQSVLFYIAGFIIYALGKKKTYQDECHKEMLARLETHSDNGDNYIGKFKKWTEKCNRGGLKVATDPFFLLMRHMELHMRKFVDLDRLTPQSLLVDSLKEGLLTNYMVSYYWDKLTSGVKEVKKCQVLEDIVCLFLKIRGNAVTKLAKKQLQKEKTRVQKDKSKVLKQKNSNSLRKHLKSYHEQ